MIVIFIKQRSLKGKNIDQFPQLNQPGNCYLPYMNLAGTSSLPSGQCVLSQLSKNTEAKFPNEQKANTQSGTPLYHPSSSRSSVHLCRYPSLVLFCPHLYFCSHLNTQDRFSYCDFWIQYIGTIITWLCQ